MINKFMKTFDIITIGSALRDMLFYTDEAELIDNPKNPIKLKLLGFEYGAKIRGHRVQFTFGGGAMNTAVNFAGLGLKTGIISCLGNDETGQEIINYLKKKKVNTSLIQTVKERTGSSLLVIDEKTEEHVIFVHYGANEKLRLVHPKGVQRSPLGCTSWFYVSGLAAKVWPTVINKLKRTSAKIAWNPGHSQLPDLKKHLPGIAVLILNKDEATELCLEATKNYSVLNLLKIIYFWGPRLIVITDGRRGVYVFDGQKVYFDKPRPHQPRDTTGAGDCFGSTFIAGLIKLKDIKKAIHLAMLNTVSLVMRPGAQNGLLTWGQLKKKI